MWVVLFLLLLNSLALQGRNTTCSIPAVEEGNVANLTCLFPSDISDSQHGLNVLFYKDSNPNNPITVVYSALTNGKLEFFTHPDFSFDEIVSDHVNILILKASKANVGKYDCHSDPSFRVKSCIFTLKVPNKSGASTHAASISTITPPIFNEEEVSQSENLNNIVIPLMVLLACMVALVIILLIVAAIICPKRLKNYISKASVSKNTSDEEMLSEQVPN